MKKLIHFLSKTLGNFARAVTIVKIIPAVASILILVLSIQTANATIDESSNFFMQTKGLQFVSETLTKAQLKECEKVYEDYSSLEKIVFNNRYQNHKFAGDCVMLFEDPIWNAKGYLRYEKISKRMTELAENLQGKGLVAMFIKNKETLELETDWYRYNFNGCTKDQYVTLDDFMAASDTHFLYLHGFEYGNIIPPNTCRTIEIVIGAEDPNSIRVTMNGLNRVMMLDNEEIALKMSPRTQMQIGIHSNDIVCKEGFQLMMKSSTGVPACVKTTSAERLLEIG